MDAGIMIDITTGSIVGVNNDPIYDMTIDFLCEKLDLTRVSLEKKLGSYQKIKETDQILGDICAICQDEFQEGYFKRVLKCEHTFHKKCVDKWLKKGNIRCPMCRKDVI